MAANEVRIIGGNWRGRKLSFPSVPTLRPSLGRVRETLFNWLRQQVADSRCLDLYAGSGALGFEALSRGAANVTFVDRDPKVVRALHENAGRLDAPGCVIVRSLAGKFLDRAAEPWDIIFLDPPFADKELATTLDQLRKRSLVAREGLVYFEVSKRAALPLQGWTLVKESVVGESRFGLLSPIFLPTTAKADTIRRFHTS